MMSEADDTVKKVCDAKVAEHAKRAMYFCSGDLNNYQLKDTLWVQRHHKDVLSWYLPGVILRKIGQDVYVIQVGNNKTVQRDRDQLLP